jgi:hypothetical protein
MSTTMVRFIYLIFIFYLICSSCDSHREEKFDIWEIVLNEYLSNSIIYFPLDRLDYLNDFKKPELVKNCNLNLDSIIDVYSESKFYNQKIISDHKLKSIYLDAMEQCFTSDELTINYISEINLSDWAKGVIDKYYPLATQIDVASNAFDSDSIAGWPYVFKKFSTLSEIDEYYNLNNLIECGQYLIISSIYTASNYYFVEIAYGCGRWGTNRYLYILRSFKGKIIIDNRLFSDFTY